MNLTVVWEKPEKIDDFCIFLIELYNMRARAISDFVKKESEKYLTKYSNELAELSMAVVDGKLSSSNISLGDVFKSHPKMPINVLGKICDVLSSAFKAVMALRDNDKRVATSIQLLRSVNLFLDMVIALIEGKEVDNDTVFNELAKIREELQQIVRSN